MSYTVAVRALCEFTAKVGDLDLRFTPSPSAQEGMLGHRRVTQGRDAGYQSEVTLSGQYHELLVRAVPTATTRRSTAWKRSRPTAATSICSPTTIANCIGPKPRSMPG